VTLTDLKILKLKIGPYSITQLIYQKFTLIFSGIDKLAMLKIINKSPLGGMFRGR
jgi:hypothetical protein